MNTVPDNDEQVREAVRERYGRDRKSTRLNSSHQIISYAVFCLKKKNILAAHRDDTSHRSVVHLALASPVAPTRGGLRPLIQHAAGHHAEHAREVDAAEVYAVLR